VCIGVHVFVVSLIFSDGGMVIWTDELEISKLVDRYDEDKCVGLFVLGISIMRANFHVLGKYDNLSITLYMWASKVIVLRIVCDEIITGGNF